MLRTIDPRRNAEGQPRKPVIVLGVFVADTAYRAARQPKMGETVLGNSFALGPGGKGSNQAIAAARAGADAHIITRLGDDAFGQLARDSWNWAGVTPAVSTHKDGYTGAAYIFIEEATGNNAIIVSPGVAADLCKADIDAQADLIRGAGLFMTQLEQPVETAHHALALARAAGVTTILNPAPAAPLPEGMLGLCDIVTPNESEAEALTGLPVVTVADAEKAADWLLEAGAGTAIITLGAQGVFVKNADLCAHVPAMAPGPVVETTGAGDAFNGGLAAALAEGQDLLAAARLGCATAGLSVTRAGTARSMPDRAEIEALLGGA